MPQCLHSHRHIDNTGAWLDPALENCLLAAAAGLSVSVGGKQHTTGIGEPAPTAAPIVIISKSAKVVAYMYCSRAKIWK